MQSDPRIDSYIAKKAPFSRPILTHLRALVAATCPEREETVKWGIPFFTYRGSLLCNMAAFKAHATFGFWQNRRVTGDDTPDDATSAMGQFGKLTSVGDLPDDAKLAEMIRRAMALIDSGEKIARPLKHPKPPVEAPEDLAAALATAPAAKAFFDALPAGQKRDYVEWITDAKREETRARRLQTTITQLAEGKRFNWKYERC